jgi:hypothetical protein
MLAASTPQHGIKAQASLGEKLEGAVLESERVVLSENRLVFINHRIKSLTVRGFPSAARTGSHGALAPGYPDLDSVVEQHR